MLCRAVRRACGVDVWCGVASGMRSGSGGAGTGGGRRRSGAGAGAGASPASLGDGVAEGSGVVKGKGRARDPSQSGGAKVGAKASAGASGAKGATGGGGGSAGASRGRAREGKRGSPAGGGPSGGSRKGPGLVGGRVAGGARKVVRAAAYAMRGGEVLPPGLAQGFLGEGGEGETWDDGPRRFRAGVAQGRPDDRTGPAGHLGVEALSPFVRTRSVKGCLHVVLDRPGKLHALDGSMVAALGEVYRGLQKEHEAGHARDPSMGRKAEKPVEGPVRGRQVVFLRSSSDALGPRAGGFLDEGGRGEAGPPGAGRAAFCAGGDVREVRDLVLAGEHLRAVEFFRDEFLLDWRTSRVASQVAVVDGVCLGGGAGLVMHGEYMVATERAAFGMPECGIGLVPDVGASWMLPRLAGSLGMYLALTGDRLLGAEVAASGVASHFVGSGVLQHVFERMEDVAYATEGDPRALDEAIREYAVPPGDVEIEADRGLLFYWEAIEACFDVWDEAQGPGAIRERVRLRALPLEEVPPKLRGPPHLRGERAFMERTLAMLDRQSPTSLRLTHALMCRGARRWVEGLRPKRDFLSGGGKLRGVGAPGRPNGLEDCLRREFNVVRSLLLAKGGHADFFEGVDKQLVRKPRGQPVWGPCIDDADVQTFLDGPTVSDYVRAGLSHTDAERAAAPLEFPVPASDTETHALVRKRALDPKPRFWSSL